MNTTHDLADKLKQVLVKTYSLYFVTHNYHWNVEGHRFISLHTFFETQYTENFTAIDELAERIRALDSYVPFYQHDDMVSKLETTEELSGDDASTVMINNLILLNQNVVSACQQAKSSAVAIDDDESEDMMIERITLHQKVIWMLKSILK